MSNHLLKMKCPKFEVWRFFFIIYLIVKIGEILVKIGDKSGKISKGSGKMDFEHQGVAISLIGLYLHHKDTCFDNSFIFYVFHSIFFLVFFACSFQRTFDLKSLLVFFFWQVKILLIIFLNWLILMHFHNSEISFSLALLVFKTMLIYLFES